MPANDLLPSKLQATACHWADGDAAAVQVCPCLATGRFVLPRLPPRACLHAPRSKCCSSATGAHPPAASLFLSPQKDTLVLHKPRRRAWSPGQPPSSEESTGKIRHAVHTHRRHSVQILHHARAARAAHRFKPKLYPLVGVIRPFLELHRLATVRGCDAMTSLCFAWSWRLPLPDLPGEAEPRSARPCSPRLNNDLSR